MQREIPWLQEVPEPELLTDTDIRRCKSWGEAVTLCVLHSRFTNETIAGRMGISPAKLTKMCKGSAGIKRNEMELLELACGNRAVTQYMAMNAGYRLVRTTTEDKIREVERQLEELKRGAA